MNQYCVSENYTIREVMEQFENNNERVAIVMNCQNKVLGVVSQGDIIRALSAGRDNYSNVSQIIQVSFLRLYEKNMEEAYKIFKKKKITLLPIIDQDGILVDVITMDDIYDYLDERK